MSEVKKVTPALRGSDIGRERLRFNQEIKQKIAKVYEMQYTEKDREVLLETWMSYKAKMRVTQIEMAKKLGMSQLAFSDILRGQKPLDHGFVSQFCQFIGVDPVLTLPSLREQVGGVLPGTVTLKNTYIVDGNIKNVRYSGNQIIVEYEHQVPAC